MTRHRCCNRSIHITLAHRLHGTEVGSTVDSIALIFTDADAHWYYPVLPAHTAIVQMKDRCIVTSNRR